MALNTLKNVKMIDGYTVKRIDWERKPGNEDFHIDISDKANAITFYLQTGPIKEVGENGCQVDTLLATAWLIIGGLNDQFPCKENTECLEHLSNAMDALKQRTARRTRQGIEGYNKEEQ